VLLLRSLWAIERIELGFDPNGVTTAFLIKPENASGFYERLLAALRAGPGVQSAALANPIPFADAGVVSGFAIKNREQPSGLLGQAQGVQVTPDYFRTLHIPLLRGPQPGFVRYGSSPLVCLIDAKFAQESFPGQDPIGQELATVQGLGAHCWSRGSHPRQYTRGGLARDRLLFLWTDPLLSPMPPVVVRSKGPAKAP